MTVPFFHVVEPDGVDAYIATRSGLALRTREIAETVLAGYGAVLRRGLPIWPWSVMFPDPAVIHEEREQLISCMARLGWRAPR